MADDPGQVLSEARNAVRQGAYAEALEKYLWFHHHALEHNPALYGVRLSYAVSEWVELGEVYPPAREALESIQNFNLRSLQDGSHDATQFRDFVAINKQLGRHELTSRVFAAVAERDPEFAKSCFSFALSALVRSGDFALARGFVVSPTERLDESLARLAEVINKRQHSPHDEVLFGIYAKNIRQLSSIFEGVGEKETAGLLQTKAIEALTDFSDRDGLRCQLLKRSMEAGYCEEYFALVANGMAQLERGNLELAEKTFGAAKFLARAVLSEVGLDVLPLALYCQSLLRLRQGRKDESRQLCERAATRPESGKELADSMPYQHLMANVLVGLGEYYRAMSYCERTIHLELAGKDPIVMAEMLARAGLCYCKSGLRDYAAVSLRAAVKTFRNCPGDPRLISTLVTLGNALRKSSPAEAEACYKEAAEMHTAKGQLESATVAWVNLGVLCSEQGRYEESLEYYQQALRVREGFATTPPERLATVLNNVANCYRRMKKFVEALASVDRAIALLEPTGGSSPLASAYGTRGLILKDDGRDSEAVEWLQKAYVMNQSVPSPNLENIAEDLVNEIEALGRLGRLEAQRIAEERLAQIRATMKATRPSDPDLGALSTDPTEGAVLVELGFGSRVGSQDQGNSFLRLLSQVSEVVERERVGYMGGKVVIPESTTLMLYGADGEELFRAIEPVLAGQPICAGANVTIRQGSKHRCVLLPAVLN